MSEIKVEWVHSWELYDTNKLSNGETLETRVPVVRLAALRAWLRAHQYPRQYGATAHNGVIEDLLDELKDQP